jgi:hypothetical protein
MANTPDLSKIIGLIMENPDLIAKIQSLANGSADDKEENPKEEPEAVSTIAEEKVEAASTEYYDPRQKRTKLLCAMKPYLSNERAKAIDSMLSVAEILDMMKSR